MKCNKCGTENTPGTKFCRGCGTKCEATAPTLPDNMIACTKCGHANQLGKKFCEKCGSPLAVSAAPVTENVAETPYSPPPTPQVPQPPAPVMPEPASPAPPYAPNTAGVYQPALANPAKTKMIVGALVAVIALSGIGGGYWYYQKVETEKAIALQRQQEEEQRLRAEAQARAEEAQRLAVQNARLEAEKRAAEERQRLQAQMQQQQHEAEQRQQQMQAQLQQQREAEQQRQRAEEARRATASSNSSAGQQFFGMWSNVDRNTRGITRFLITRRGTLPTIHIWGSCSPTECDWGETQSIGTGNDGSLYFRYIKQGYGTTNVSVIPAGLSRVRLETYTKYEDSRPDRRATEFMEHR